jgi:hypothetical protein
LDAVEERRGEERRGEESLCFVGIEPLQYTP